MSRLTDVSLLHPVMRDRSRALESAFAREGLPLRRYEGARTPQRQANLYARGRTIHDTRKVTRAQAWESLHQYGLAEDWVFWGPSGWTWEEPEPGAWKRYHEIASAVNLVPLDFEKPHVQIPGVLLSHLRRGVYPPGGDASWEAWLEEQIETWGPMRVEYAGLIHPGAPPAVDIDLRPELVA